MSATTTTATSTTTGQTAAKTGLITGATRGIGLAFAVQYKASGWNVIGAARNLDKADQLKALAPYKIVQLDTSDEASILHAATLLQSENISLLVNNAGIAEPDTFETATKASMLSQFETNAVGPFLVTRAFAPQLRASAAKHGSATVIQVGSTMGSITANDGGALGTGNYTYRTSKTALNMINACLALDLKKDKIVAVSVCPGYVSTEMNAGQGQHTAAESVAALAKVIAGLTDKDTGRFFLFDGSSISW